MNSLNMEALLIGRTIIALSNAGYRCELSDQDGGDGLFLYAWQTERRPAKHDRWVRFTPGNGVDALTDYTTNLEEVLKPVNALAAFFMQSDQS